MNKEQQEPLKMSLMEAWKMYQSLKYTFSVANKNQVAEIFEKEFNIKFFDLPDNLKGVTDLDLYNKLKNESNASELSLKLKDNALLMTQDEWLWRPVEEGLMPFLFEILNAVDARRNSTISENNGPSSPGDTKVVV